MHLLSLTSLCQSVEDKETENKKEAVISEGNKNLEPKILEPKIRHQNYEPKIWNKKFRTKNFETKILEPKIRNQKLGTKIRNQSFETINLEPKILEQKIWNPKLKFSSLIAFYQFS